LNLANALIPINLDKSSFNQKDFDDSDFKKKFVMNKKMSR